eukprot:6178352-Pleurochrysis_carterae.AAC.1
MSLALVRARLSRAVRSTFSHTYCPTCWRTFPCAFAARFLPLLGETSRREQGSGRAFVAGVPVRAFSRRSERPSRPCATHALSHPRASSARARALAAR